MDFPDEVELVYAAIESCPVDVAGLAEKLGIKVHQAYLDDNISGMLECRAGQYKITVNASQPNTRQRFTIAHELGHYALHRHLVGNGVDDTVAYRSENVGKYHNTDIGPYEETQANRFAAGLLMPSELIKKVKRKNPAITLREMADKFQVSKQAMGFRLDGMGWARNG